MFTTNWVCSPSRRCNFASRNKGQCLHGALLQAVFGCCKRFQQCRIAWIARAESTPPVALKMSSRDGLGAMLHQRYCVYVLGTCNGTVCMC